MTIRKFVAGDRVQKRSGGPIMIVQKYCLRQHVFGGNSHSGQFFRHHPMSIITLVTLVNLAFQHKKFQNLVQ